jgi:hypothetical protein
MNRIQNEARLERSLRSQIVVPKLDGRFDAAVWSRIAAEEKKVLAPLPVRSRMPRWLVACNVAGIAVTVALVLFYVAPSVGELDLGVQLGLELPSLSAAQQKSLLEVAGPVIATAAVLFGLMFTRFGRRLLSALR